jgi:pectate lyase
MDLAGNPLSLAGRSPSSRMLTADEVAAGFSSRAQILSAFGGGAGWDPAP